MLEGSEVVYVERLESATTMRMFDRLGQRVPAYVTSSGKCLLAWAPPDRVDVVIAAGLARRAPRTITSEAMFLRALDDVRSRGYAVSVEESERDVASVAAPVRGSDGAVVAAVSIAGPTLARERVDVPSPGPAGASSGRPDQRRHGVPCAGGHRRGRGSAR